MDNEEIIRELAETHGLASRNEGRIKALENENKVLHELSTSVALMAQTLEQNTKSLAALAVKVDSIESEPAKRWKALVVGVINTVVGIAVGALAAYIGLGG